MKMRRFIPLPAAAICVFLLSSSAALAVRLGVWDVASASDMARVTDGILIAENIERYYRKTHHYPLMDHVEPAFVTVAITNGPAPEGMEVIPVAQLEKELSRVLHETIRLPRDPQDTGKRLYYYTTNGQDYYVTSLLENYMPFTRVIDANYSALPISSRPSRHDKVAGLKELRTFVYKGTDVPETQEKLLKAVKDKDYAAAEDALKKGANLDPSCDFDQNCKPLGQAAGAGEVQMVDFLLQNGADVNGMGAYEDVPLISAMKNGHTVVALQLLVAGADVNIANAFGITPFIGAVHDGREELVRQMIAGGAKLDEHYLQDNSQAKEDEFGERPLEAAINAKNEKLVVLLLQSGANAKLKGQDGAAMQELATASGNATIAELVKKAAAK